MSQVCLYNIYPWWKIDENLGEILTRHKSKREDTCRSTYRIGKFRQRQLLQPLSGHESRDIYPFTSAVANKRRTTLPWKMNGRITRERRWMSGKCDSSSVPRRLRVPNTTYRVALCPTIKMNPQFSSSPFLPIRALTLLHVSRTTFRDERRAFSFRTINKRTGPVKTR